jgi:hypothetical protein
MSLIRRTGKQCRERWLTKLSPAFTSEAWTAEEDEMLVRLQSIHGNRWSMFRADLAQRSTTAIKNRWVSLRRRRSRQGNSIETPPVAEWVEPIAADGYQVPLDEAEVDDGEIGFDDLFSWGELSWCL